MTPKELNRLAKNAVAKPSQTCKNKTIKKETGVKGVTVVDKDKYLVMMGFNFGIPWGVPTVAHECLHAVNGILEARGVVPDFKNDEIQCYLLEWLMEKVVNILLIRERELAGHKD